MVTLNSFGGDLTFEFDHSNLGSCSLKEFYFVAWIMFYMNEGILFESNKKLLFHFQIGRSATIKSTNKFYFISHFNNIKFVSFYNIYLVIFQTNRKASLTVAESLYYITSVIALVGWKFNYFYYNIYCSFVILGAVEKLPIIIILLLGKNGFEKNPVLNERIFFLLVQQKIKLWLFFFSYNIYCNCIDSN